MADKNFQSRRGTERQRHRGAQSQGEDENNHPTTKLPNIKSSRGDAEKKRENGITQRHRETEARRGEGVSHKEQRVAKEKEKAHAEARGRGGGRKHKRAKSAENLENERSHE